MELKRKITDKEFLHICLIITICVAQPGDFSLMRDIHISRGEMNGDAERDVKSCGESKARLGAAILVFIQENIDIAILRCNVHSSLCVKRKGQRLIQICK